jgi:homoserine acetyltransferase
MGCTHSRVWGETYPDFSDALMPPAWMPVPIAGRNRMTRKRAMDAIIDDPGWMQGEYKTGAEGIEDVHRHAHHHGLVAPPDAEARSYSRFRRPVS